MIIVVVINMLSLMTVSDPEEGDEDETEQNGGCEGPLCDDKFLDGPENDDLFDVPEEDVVNSGFPNIQSHAQGKDKPCKGLDSSKCVVLLQNGIIFGPYKIPGMFKGSNRSIGHCVHHSRIKCIDSNFIMNYKTIIAVIDIIQ